jgi:hypothetical protein
MTRLWGTNFMPLQRWSKLSWKSPLVLIPNDINEDEKRRGNTRRRELFKFKFQLKFYMLQTAQRDIAQVRALGFVVDDDNRQP